MGPGGLLGGEVGRRESVGERKSVPLPAALGAHGGRSQRSTREGLRGGEKSQPRAKTAGRQGRERSKDHRQLRVPPRYYL